MNTHVERKTLTPEAVAVSLRSSQRYKALTAAFFASAGLGVYGAARLMAGDVTTVPHLLIGTGGVILSGAGMFGARMYEAAVEGTMRARGKWHSNQEVAP